MEAMGEKETWFRSRLRHCLIREVRGRGLMLALILERPEMADQLILKCMAKGLLLFWLLFEPRAVRISPPLTISKGEIDKGCDLILEVLDELAQ
jgi:acetylornithine/succinyldiaminopimelate/putrescine aminotransferase